LLKCQAIRIRVQVTSATINQVIGCEYESIQTFKSNGKGGDKSRDMGR
jgi:hypothetical protein